MYELAARRHDGGVRRGRGIKKKKKRNENEENKNTAEDSKNGGKSIPNQESLQQWETRV
jgi:hypothetical protein